VLRIEEFPGGFGLERGINLLKAGQRALAILSQVDFPQETLNSC
jgi:hypothetical protein